MKIPKLDFNKLNKPQADNSQSNTNINPLDEAIMLNPGESLGIDSLSQ